MRLFVFPPIFLALTACGGEKVIRVQVPVPVPCITETVAEPVYPTVGEDAGIYERVKVLLAERELRLGYEAKLKAQVAACGEVK